jgi:hypothetical protein
MKKFKNIPGKIDMGKSKNKVGAEPQSAEA